MKEIQYILTKTISVFIKGKKQKKRFINNWFRKQGVMIGDNCSIFCNVISSEPYMITIKDNVTISNNVQLITHDNSIIKVSNGEFTDLFGEIVIGNNCFIGAHSIILPGVKLCDNVIIAAGSVMTKSINEEFTVWGGNPARKIGDWNSFYNNNKSFGINTSGMSYEEKKQMLIKSKSKLKVK